MKKGIQIKRAPAKVKIYKLLKNNNLLKKREGDAMNNNGKRPLTPAESLEESLKEMQLMRSGQKKKRTWREYRNDIRSNSNE